MPTYSIPGPDGQVYSIDGPEGATREQVIAAIQSRMKATPKVEANDGRDHTGEEQAARIRGYSDDARKQGVIAAPLGFAEAALNAGSGIGSSIVGGIAGLARTGYGLATGEGFDKASEAGSGVIHSVQDAATYQPRTGVGKAAADALTIPMNIAKSMGREIGGDTGQFVGGDKGRLIGTSIGDVAPDIAGTLAGGVGALRGARALANRPTVPVAGRDFSPLRDLTPEQQARMDQMRSQGIEPTLGQITRDPQQFRFEDQTGKKEVGADLRTRELDTNDALIQAIEDNDTLRAGRGTAENTREVGATTARALEENAAESLKGVDEKYDAARAAGETEEVVDTTPLEQFLADNKPEALTVSALNSIAAKLESLKSIKGEDGITINDLENIYQSAGKLGKADDTAGHYMGQVKDVINQMTDGVGGDLYRDARKARLAHAMEYEDRGAIADLIDKKAGSRTDYKTASEDVFKKTVLNSSLEQLKDVTNSLLSKDPATNPGSWQAVRELQAETVRWILDQATSRGVLNERGAPGLSPTKLRDAVNSIGRDKLTHLLGPEVLARLDDTVANARNTKQAPGKVQGSDTSVNLHDNAQQMLMAEAKTHLLSKIPGVSVFAKYMAERAKARQMRQDISDALTPQRAGGAQVDAMAADANAQNRGAFFDAAGQTVTGAAPLAYTAASEADRRMLEKRSRAQNTMRKLSNLGRATSVDEAIQSVQP